MSGGVLPAQWIHKAIVDEVIHAGVAFEDGQVQPASLDLRLGGVAHRLRCSFVPGDDTVEARLADYSMEAIDLTSGSGAILERDRPYLIPLLEELSLPEATRARTNPKSSTGRVDVFCRVITDRSHRFDEIAAGYQGRLWLEVVPRSFTIKVRTGLRLNQLRLVTGHGVLGDAELRELHVAEPLLWRDAIAPSPVDLVLAGGLFLGVDLTGSGSQGVGYKAKRNSKLLDLSRVRAHKAEDFWEPVTAEAGDRLVLEPEDFYLLISSERVRIPPGFAAEMTAYDPTAGELRTHYAGFFDPGFGHRPGSAESEQGTRAVLEVRARDVPFMLEHGQSVCKLVYEPMLDEPDVLYGSALASNYQDQDLTLSKHFVPAGRQVGDSDP